jgi:hypothetical protein
MAKKKHKAKNSQSNQAVSPRSRKKVLGIDVRDLGAAIAAAVIGEIAQVAIQKANRTSGSDSDQHNTPADAAHHSLQNTVDSVKEAFTSDPLQHGAAVVAGALNQINPALGKLATAVKDTTETTGQSVGHTADQVSDTVIDTVGDTLNTTQHTAENATETVTQSVSDTAETLNRTVRDAVQAATHKVITSIEQDNSKNKKSKKGKGKKKHQKKSKK